MSFKVKKLIVGRGKTTGNEKAGEWNRVYYELEAEAEAEDEHQIELAKGSMEALLDAWVRGENITPGEKPNWDSSKIKWTQEEGAKGLFEKSEDVDSLDFKNLIKDLNAQKGKLYRDGYFYWLYQSGSTVGRKLKGKGKSKAKESDSENVKTMEGIKQKFPQELQDLLSFEVQDESVIIKPRQFLGSENFAKIADIVKAHGGDYVSAGKESHFKIPLKTS
jgi:hypothetical protein